MYTTSVINCYCFELLTLFSLRNFFLYICILYVAFPKSWESEVKYLNFASNGLHPRQWGFCVDSFSTDRPNDRPFFFKIDYYSMIWTASEDPSCKNSVPSKLQIDLGSEDEILLDLSL